MKFNNFVNFCIFAPLFKLFLAFLRGLLALKVFHLRFEPPVQSSQSFEPVYFISNSLIAACYALLLTFVLVLVNNHLLRLPIWLLIWLLKETIIVLNFTIFKPLHKIVEYDLDLFLHVLWGWSILLRCWIWALSSFDWPILYYLTILFERSVGALVRDNASVATFRCFLSLLFDHVVLVCQRQPLFLSLGLCRSVRGWRLLQVQF